MWCTISTTLDLNRVRTRVGSSVTVISNLDISDASGGYTINAKPDSESRRQGWEVRCFFSAVWSSTCRSFVRV